MIKAIVFDADGMIIRKDQVFSGRFSQEFKINYDKIIVAQQPFIQSLLVLMVLQ